MKRNLIFFLTCRTITTNEITENGELKIQDVDGMEKYEYDSPDDFAHFFDALKTDIYNIQSFAEEDFYVTIFDMSVSGKPVPKETLDNFKNYLEDCKNVSITNAEEVSKVFTGNVQSERITELEKEISKKDDEIKSLNENIADCKNEIDGLKDKIAKKDKRLAELEPKRSVVKTEYKGRLTWNRLAKSTSSDYAQTFKQGYCPRGFSINTEIAYIYRNPNRRDIRSSDPVETTQQGFLHILVAEDQLVEIGDPIAVMTTKPDDTEINQWLEKNGVNSKTLGCVF